MGDIAAFVDKIIADNKVAVFSKSYCPFCDMAKQALKESGITEYYLLEIENRSDCAAIQDYLLKLTGARTVPRVFINGKCIGGGSEAKALAKSGQLKALAEA